MDAADWDERYRGQGLLWHADPNRFFAEETADLPPGRALDLACGEGRNAIWLAERGWRVTAVDFSRVALEKARRQADERGVEVEWVLADVLDFDPEPGAHDLVAILYLQLPAHQRRAVVQRAAGALAPGATLLVIGHDTSNLTDGVGGPQDAHVLFTADDVIADLDGAAGLQVERAEVVQRPVDVDGVTRHALDALVRLRR